MRIFWVAVSSLILGACAIPGAPVSRPDYKPKLYAGDSARAAISRSQDNEILACNAPSFNDFVCLSYRDYLKFLSTYVYSCTAYRSQDEIQAILTALEGMKP